MFFLKHLTLEHRGLGVSRKSPESDRHSIAELSLGWKQNSWDLSILTGNDKGLIIPIQ